jgi:hypothetical protein
MRYTCSFTLSGAAVLATALVLAACDRSATAPPALDAVELPAALQPLLQLQFAKCVTDPVNGIWEGQVTGDIEGELRTELRALTVTGSIWHVQFAWIIAADEQSFVADLSGTLNLTTGSVVMDGTVSAGYREGARVHEEGQLVDAENSCFAGVIRILPSSAPPVAASLDATSGTASAEVWIVDQSNTTGLGYGGAIYIFDAPSLMGDAASAAVPTAVIDLSGATAALCASSTGAHPVRPHMLFFNSRHSHGVLAFVASGHVVIFDAEAREPVACLRASPGAGGARQAHAAVPAPNDAFILVANQNGKLLERIASNYETNTFVLDAAATLDLANCVTPNGATCEAAGLRPDNAPICPVFSSNPAVSWITLRGGGLFVVDATVTPIGLIGEYDMDTIHPNGCGGAEGSGRMFLNSGGGTPANLYEFDVYAFPLTGYDAGNAPNTPERTLIFSDDVAGRDAHGAIVVSGNLWVFDRGTNVAEVFDAASGAHVGTVNLAGAVSADPTPDLADVSPAGNRLFVSLRGPTPLSGDPHVATGSTPGLGVVQLSDGGRQGVLKAVASISNPDADGVERADPHGIRLRRR